MVQLVPDSVSQPLFIEYSEIQVTLNAEPFSVLNGYRYLSTSNSAI